MTFARTKIQPPRPRSAFVERGALQARLAAALRSRRLVLLCAPGGFGKTALLAYELAHWPADYALAWIAADAGDDLHRLLDCLLAALEPYDPPWRSAPEALLAWATRDDEARRRAAAELINTLDACSVTHGVIVFDDVHRVADAAFFGFLDLLLERLPPRWTLALTSRTEPPLAALPRLRAAGEVEELRQLNLQFAREEAHRLIEGAGLPAALADRLFDRTHGWPAGLRIAIGAVQGAGALAGAQASAERALRATDRPLFDFLVHEVLTQLPAPLSDFLRAASVLPELNAARCAAVTGDVQAAAHLAALERLGLFVDVIDTDGDGGHALRMHDLLRDALRAQLAQEDPDRLRELQRGAAQTEPDPLRGVPLWLAAGDAQAAAALAFEHLPALIVTAGATSALHVMEQFAPAERARAPELAFVRGLAVWGQDWEFEQMLREMWRAESGFAQHGQHDAAQLARANAALALIATGRFDEAQALIARVDAAPTDARTAAVLLNARAWLAIDQCRYAEVAPTMSALLDLLQAVDRIDLWYQTTPPLRMPGLPGMTPVLERHAALLLQVSGDTPTPLRAIGLLTQAWVSLWRGELAAARECMASAHDDAHWSGGTGAVRGHLLTLQAVLAAIAGEAAAAIEAAQARSASFARLSDPWHRYILALFVARVAACCEAPQALREALASVETLRPPGSAELTRPRELPLIAQLAWLEGRTDAAIDAWQAALAMESQIDVMGCAAEVRLRLACALLRQGPAARLEQAAALVTPALATALRDGPGGLLLAGSALGELAAAPLGPTAQAALQRWWRVVAAERASANKARAAVATVATGAAPLSGREREVLARIAAGDSNKLIARAFDLSLHTVKRHVANILGKLNVQTRGQAAAWYRAHG